MTKLRGVIAAAVMAAVFTIGIQSAGAWHAADVKVTATCNGTTGVWDITAEITQSGQWPGAVVKSITPTSFPGATTGSKAVVVKVGWPNSSHTQTFTRYVTLDGTCKVLCEPVERIVYVDRVVEKIVTVPGPERVVEKLVYVTPLPERVVEKIVEKPVEKIVTIVKPAKVKPCAIPAKMRGNSKVRRGKDGNCYIQTTVTRTVTKVVRAKPKPAPKVKGCRGACEKLKQGASG